MRVDNFDFTLPEGHIADRPVSPREAARLLHVSPAGLADYQVGKLHQLLRPGDILVFNDTRVIPARLYGNRGPVSLEVLLYSRDDDNTWLALAKRAKRLRPGDSITFGDDFSARVVGKVENGSVRLAFDCEDQAFTKALQQYGHIPLPPYIKRRDDFHDRADYQTIFAKKEGAIAAPTAGLHFTNDLLQKLEDAGVGKTFVTLHVGLGTFLSVTSEDTADHVMHQEWGEISSETAEQLSQAKVAGRRVVAVGTTSLRLLESAAKKDGSIAPFRGFTDLFIVPGFRFKVVDVLMTNFHLPRSTLFMLVSAFVGLDNAKAAYAHAIENDYRFYSYGDACLLERKPQS